MGAKFRMGQKVKILDGQKADGRFNDGIIVGVEKMQDAHYLGYKNKEEFLGRFKNHRYKVAYVDCFTNRAIAEWFYETDLERLVVK